MRHPIIIQPIIITNYSKKITVISLESRSIVSPIKFVIIKSVNIVISISKIPPPEFAMIKLSILHCKYEVLRHLRTGNDASLIFFPFLPVHYTFIQFSITFIVEI
ncbi:hypothetical protein RCL_jg684.t1 [Rhizophagus clarus]|uniref:Uncharacterized protein n=1 Tax=Rhizophagus clarus TaxID=94130 RepID=A0A8H3LBQ2_9GLOM|nr:hypothetical protein RCL_jg684.t1 [Rhizophagus clarus]